MEAGEKENVPAWVLFLPNEEQDYVMGLVARVGTLTQERQERLDADQPIFVPGDTPKSMFARWCDERERAEAAEAALAEAREEAAFWKGTANIMADEEVPALVKRFQQRVRAAESAREEAEREGSRWGRIAEINGELRQELMGQLADMRRALEPFIRAFDEAVRNHQAKWHYPRDGVTFYATHGMVDEARRALAAAGPAPEPLPSYPATPVDCLISELRDGYGPGHTHSLMTRSEFEQRIAQFKAEAAAGPAPWEGHPDPSSHGGHPYTPTEIAMGYGTPNDPRFRAAGPAPEEGTA